MNKKEYSFFKIQDNVLKTASLKTAQEVIFDLERLRDTDVITDYAISSVEINMFRHYYLEAIDIVKPHNEKELKEKIERIISNTPYTNWSGD